MTRGRLASVLLSVLLLAPALACRDGGAGPVPVAGGELALTAVVAGTPVTKLVVDVSARDIAPSLTFNIPVADGVATGSILVPPGEARTITVRAFESGGAVTHEGSRTLDVRPGPNPPLSIPMIPRPGNVPIEVALGPVSIVVTPGAVSLVKGATQAFAARIVAANGEEVKDDPRWATTNPAVADVDAKGVVTGLAAGSAQIVATYAGVAAIATVTVK